MYKLILNLISLGLLCIVLAVIGAFLWFKTSDFDIPDYKNLARYEPPVTTRLYAGDGQILMEYAVEKRIFVPESKIPDLVKNAFIAAEDKHFYSHPGIDLFGITRAIFTNIKNYLQKKRMVGASTITQQVAKNFLLSSERSLTRKIKEAILAYRISKAFSKSHVLELYLNEIYLGNRSYGVAAAALNYFNKALDELTIEEAAYLAALPKGPNNYHPHKHPEAAIARRNWVIDRMQEDDYITKEQAETAKKSPLKVIDKHFGYLENGEYFSDEVRRLLAKSLGDDAIFEGGLMVRTTINPELQTLATKTFRSGLLSYDRRHGYRHTGIKISLEGDYKAALAKTELPKGAEKNWHKSVVLSVEADKAKIETQDGKQGEINLKSLAWARKTLADQRVSLPPKKVSDVLEVGDVIYTEEIKDGIYELRQVPDVEGAMVVMSPHNGKILAMVGGFSFDKSQFNRATQAYRQTGSTFKPFVYVTALEMGYSPTDLILDAPFVLDQGPGLPLWKPSNYSKGFSGLTTLRQGIEKSKNLMTVRLAQDIGMDRVAEMAKRLGVMENLPHLLSMSLGAADTRLIDMVTAYSVFVNGGLKVSPYLIEQIQDRYGKSLYKNNSTHCLGCRMAKFDDTADVPEITDERARVLDELSAYQMVSILQGVAIRGTGARLASLHKNLAGKTGTTNENKDAWFIGFSPDLVVGIYVGFDEPRTLGRIETGAAVALPIFYDFMKEALKDKPNLEFRVPQGIKFVRVNPKTGRPAGLADKVVIIEALKPDFRFGDKQRVVGNDGRSMLDAEGSAEDHKFDLGSEY
ncbi:MAG: penicillin-binding protein 1A [Alphaproteobacteria bacterium]|nr:penicillin-binding protein 1A [Alphaproteobacteria bacterium]